MYVNHRPIFGVSKEQISDAISALAGTPKGELSRDAIMRALSSHAEALSETELAQCLRLLVGTDDPDAAIPAKVDAKVFAEDILGFQDYSAA